MAVLVRAVELMGIHSEEGACAWFIVDCLLIYVHGGVVVWESSFYGVVNASESDWLVAVPAVL